MTSRISARAARRALLLCIGLAGAALLVVACAPLALINSLVPADTYTVTRDVAYGDNARQRLDVYVPARAVPAGARAAPVIVFFYGGGWTSGARADYLFAGEAFASRGFVAVVADYRLYPEVKFPQFLHDSAAAVAWVAQNAEKFSGDPARIYLAGHSAGAYNAAMLAYAPDYLVRAGVEPKAIRGLIGLAGPYDFLPVTASSTRAIFGYPHTPPETQPIHFVGPTPGRRLVPALLLMAPDDTVVKPGNSVRLAARLRESGANAIEISYPSLDHQRIVGALAAPLRNLAPVLDDIASFVEAQP